MGDRAELDLLMLRRTMALACRVLSATETSTPILGHISLRLPDGRVLMRCRGPQERGLLFTTIDDIRIVGLDDRGDVGGGYRLPNEYPIHAEILRARPDVGSVVHAHSTSAVVAGLARLPLRPIVGAFNIPAFRLAAEGVPVWAYGGLVRTSERARSLAATLGGGPACLLLGHGVVTVGASPVASLVRAMDLEELARMTIAVAAVGGRPAEVAEEDRADLPDLGADFNEQAVWRYHLQRLRHDGLADVG